jgi:hypothetical protein
MAGNSVEKYQLRHAKDPKVPEPPYRPLRAYAYDPSIGANLGTFDVNEAVLKVRWEQDLQPGPIGEYIEVIDVDPASECCYAPVDLNDPHILTQSGLTPSEANPQFHQQMAYAVAMKTVEHFERALGRRAQWAPRRPPNQLASEYVQRLRIYPHALRARNAYYSPERTALLLGYFTASTSNPGSSLPGGVVFTAVSHDIIAHETTHALLHGLHLRSVEQTNPDVFAFHEAFADIVAVFQHFTLPEALTQQIAATRGDLEKRNLLGQLGMQFGEATGRFGALRDYVGRMVTTKDAADPSAENKESWVRAKTSRKDYENATEAHDRGAILVAAVYDAFLQIYTLRKADLLRLATGGTGVLAPGNIPVDLVNRLAREASKVAGHFLNMCIRALDYCPPVDLTFGEYLRAIITADVDLVKDDKYGYRTAIVGAFRDRGIYPRDVKHLAPDSLVWEPPPLPIDPGKLRAIMIRMSVEREDEPKKKKRARERSERRLAYDRSKDNAKMFWYWLMDPKQVKDDEVSNLGVTRIQEIQNTTIDGVPGELRKIEVHSVRPARRVGPDGEIRADIVIEITQTFRPEKKPNMRIRGGCTLLIDRSTFEIRYLIRKKLRISEDVKNKIESGGNANFGLTANYFDEKERTAEPFALMHRVFE